MLNEEIHSSIHSVHLFEPVFVRVSLPCLSTNSIHISIMDHVIGLVTKGISRGIAVGSEAVAGRKDRRSLDGAGPRQESATSDDEEDISYVDQAWELDAVYAQVETPPVQAATVGTSVDDIVSSFLQAHQSSLQAQITPKPLPNDMSVILPQRRPKDRSRGFVRAYAPVLSDAGISQDVFIDFLNAFDRGSKAAPIFDVINIACFGLSMVPSTICIAVSASVGTVNQVAQELHRNYKTNQFLDKVNQALFMPRGLFAMVMAYNPDKPDEAILRVDTSVDATSTALYKTLTTGDESSNLKQKFRRLRKSSGKSTDLTFPECAPLIYPSLDLVAQSNELTNTKSGPLSINLRSPVVQDYLDRRAQAEFAQNNPNSKLNSTLPPQDKKYVNRFADPDHPVNAGSIYALVSGGTWDPVARSRVRRAESRAKKLGQPPLTDQEKHDAYMGRVVRGKSMGTPSKKIPVIGRILKKDVLYLTIVNLPSAEEMERIKRELDNA
jgi:hypothetical protein